MNEYVIQIDFIDRQRLGLEIFQKFEANHIDKVAMEANPNQGMMIKFRCSQTYEVEQLLQDLKTIDGVTSIQFVDQMPSEERAQRLNTILNSVSEGVVAVDKEGFITHINRVACKIFYCTPAEAIGLKADELFSVDPPVLQTLKTGQSYNFVERKFKRKGKPVHFLTSGVPVLNKKGQIIGAVTTIKDFKQVQEIISKVDHRKRLTLFEDIVYQSEKMGQLVNVAKTVAKGNSTILLRGESGTGKELFATAIHMEGSRRNAPFIPINCAALPDTLLESELFGYEEGAFTGASKGGKKGLFEQANKGTLFLDEIGEISSQVQVRLLRVLQEGTIRRVGGNTEIPIDVRIIAATNRNLEEMIHKGEFREDLYYRLNVIPLKIPSLRERRDDIPLIAQHLIRKISFKLSKQEIRLSHESVELLTKYNWPGNVRQLENTLERLINMVDAPEIQPQHLFAWTDMTDTRKTLRNNNTPHHNNTLNVEIPIKSEWPPLKEIVANIEKEVILRVLEQYPSSRLAGQALGVSNTTILNKMKTYQIKP